MTAPTAALLVDGREVAVVEIADTAVRRARGMLLRRRLPPGLVLRRTGSVHGVGMTCTLDVALLDDDDVVRRVLRLRPFGLTLPHRRVRHVLEAPAGSFERWGLAAGARLRVVTEPPTAGSGAHQDGP